MSAFAARIGSGGWPLSRVQRSHCHPYRRRSVLQSLVMTLVQAESSTTPQTATCEVFLAESFTPGTFGRRNYFGVNWGRRVLVPGFPYALQVSFVVVLRAPAGLAINDLSLALSSSWGDNFKHHAGSLEAPDAELTYVVEWFGLNFVLREAGDFRLDVTATGLRHGATWTADVGPGPLRRNTTKLGGSSLIDSRRLQNPLADLASEVRGSLMIADQYATPEFMRSFLPATGAAWSCRLIVSDRSLRQNRQAWLDLLKDQPALEVRADDLIHDRFIVRDDEEAYAFGHSLKDLDKGRVSFFSRIYDVEQFQLIRDTMTESWHKATPLTLTTGAG